MYRKLMYRYSTENNTWTTLEELPQNASIFPTLLLFEILMKNLNKSVLCSNNKIQHFTLDILSYEKGISWQFGNFAEFSVEGFWRRLRDCSSFV